MSTPMYVEETNVEYQIQPSKYYWRIFNQLSATENWTTPSVMAKETGLNIRTCKKWLAVLASDGIILSHMVYYRPHIVSTIYKSV